MGKLTRVLGLLKSRAGHGALKVVALAALAAPLSAAPATPGFYLEGVSMFFTPTQGFVDFYDANGSSSPLGIFNGLQGLKFTGLGAVTCSSGTTCGVSIQYQIYGVVLNGPLSGVAPFSYDFQVTTSGSSMEYDFWFTSLAGDPQAGSGLNLAPSASPVTGTGLLPYTNGGWDLSLNLDVRNMQVGDVLTLTIPGNSIDINNANLSEAPVPEPSTWALLATGGGLLLLRVRRRRA